MKKKDILFILMGIILAFALGFLLRGVLIEKPSIIIERPKVDEEKLRAEIRSEIETEIDVLVAERMEIIVPGQVIEEHKAFSGKVVSVDHQAQTIEIQIKNELRFFTGGSLVEFLNQPHYFIKTVLVINETKIGMFAKEGIINSVFQEIKQGNQILVVTDQFFKMGTKEILTAERVTFRQ